MLKDLIEKGDLDYALEIIRQYEKVVLNDVEMLSFKGVIYYAKNELDKAKEIFKKGLLIDSTYSDLYFNLGCVFESEGDIQTAIRYFKRALEFSKIEEEKKDVLEKLKVHENIASSVSDTKISFFVKAGLDSFIEDVILGLMDEYFVRKIIVTDFKQIDEGMQWADICWFEWCDELVIYGSRHELAREKKLICRIHRYEAFTNYIFKVEWENIDKVIFVASHIFDIVNSKLKGNIKNKSSVIPNGIRMEDYNFRKREKGFNLAYVGYLNYRKSPNLLLQIISKLRRIDKRYRLFIAGEFQDEENMMYFKYMLKEMGLEEHVIFDGWQKDINSWLEDKNYVLCCSISESQNMSIMEAMAKGIKPVIHNFVAAREIYPSYLIWDTIDEAVEMILSEDYDSAKYRAFIEANYSLKQQNIKIKGLLQELISNKQNKDIEMYYSKESITISKTNIIVIDPISVNMSVDVQRYEEDLEYKLGKYNYLTNYLSPDMLLHDNIRYMLDFLYEFIDKGVPYQKTLYYAFLLDVYKKGYYLNKPEIIIDRFIQLFNVIKRDGLIKKPIVTFINDGHLKGLTFSNGKTVSVRIPDHIKLWVISGRHRVAIAKYLGFDNIPVYVLKNSFLDKERGQIISLLPAYWAPYMEKNLEFYKEQIAQNYIGAFDGKYQSYIDENKKSIVEKFVLKVKPKLLIDVGCNRGELSYGFIKYGINVLGIDISSREELMLPNDYNFIQLDIVKDDLPFPADVILFLSVYHHIFYNYGKEKADEVFYKLLRKSKYLIFDTGHAEESGIYRQSWIKEVKKYFKTEKELLDHFGVPYEILGKWKTTQGDNRTIVVFTNKELE